MGVRPTPLCATARMNKIESSSIYTDLQLSRRLDIRIFVRFYDDIGALTPNRRKAELLCSLIEQNDSTGLLKLTLDYPTSSEKFTPYLNTEVKINRDGSVNSRSYRKEQKKLLTLNASSHHPMAIKEHTISNMYATAKQVSSSEDNTLHSTKMVDNLLYNNGHGVKALNVSNKKKKKNKRRHPTNHVTTLKIPFLSDQCTAEIRKAANEYDLPVRVVTTPGRKLGDILTSSKPRDPPQCPNTDCRCCNALVKGKCMDKGVVYKLTCKVEKCNKTYDGETGRPLHKRYNEHYRSANNPTCKSYKKKAVAQHYAECHSGKPPKFDLEVMERAPTTKLRKIKEARIILTENPEINNRSEQSELKQYLV